MKRIKITVLVILALLISSTIAHAILLPQPTRCMVIGWYNFENKGDLYFRSDVSPQRVDSLLVLIEQANKRVASFYGKLTTHPTYIYCDRDEDFLLFGAPFITPAAAVMPLKAYVVIGREGINLDIIAHEIAHTELFDRLGPLDRMKIPVWFDEGLAMQVDYRSYYSTEDLLSKVGDIGNVPDVRQLKGIQEFAGVDRETVLLNYAAARYTVGQWYAPEKLSRFIDSINEGMTFDEAYDQ